MTVSKVGDRIFEVKLTSEKYGIDHTILVDIAKSQDHIISFKENDEGIFELYSIGRKEMVDGKYIFVTFNEIKIGKKEIACQLVFDKMSVKNSRPDYGNLFNNVDIFKDYTFNFNSSNVVDLDKVI